MIDEPGNGYRARHAQPSPVAIDEWAEGTAEDTADFRFTVRPYTWTRGRTQPVADLALETLVSTSEQGRDSSAICSMEHAAIVQLCAEVRSVAEVAALLALPLGVVRVLLADMIYTGLMHVHPNLTEWDSVPSLPVMERVLAGLQRF